MKQELNVLQDITVLLVQHPLNLVLFQHIPVHMVLATYQIALCAILDYIAEVHHQQRQVAIALKGFIAQEVQHHPLQIAQNLLPIPN